MGEYAERRSCIRHLRGKVVMMTKNRRSTPYVSIGMPVFNGERFLERAVETLLVQDFDDFELLISDNGSTDGTEELCRAYERSDPRVRYERQEVNRGAAWNFTHVLEVADPSARYFKWVAADDEHAPTYLARTVEILDDDPSVAVAHSGTADIDEEGYVLKVWHQPVSRLESHDPAERLLDLVTHRHECFQAFALIRSDVARAGRGLLAISDADNVQLVELALRGRFVNHKETLFFRRQHANRSMAAFVNARDRVAWFDPSKADRIAFPAWRLGWEFVRAIRDAPLTASDRRRCYLALHPFLECNWQALLKNVLRSSVEAPGVAARRVARRASAFAT